MIDSRGQRVFLVERLNIKLMKNKLNILNLVILAAIMLVPFTASASTLEELEVELARLQNQYKELTKGGSGSSPRLEGSAIYQVQNLECTDISRDLRYLTVDGPTNEEVKELQMFLKAVGDYTYPQATGFYGFETIRAVTRFQTREGILPAEGRGVVESTTRDRIKDLSCDGEDAPVINPAIIPSGMQGIPYLSSLRLDNKNGIVSLAIVEGRLPSGLYFASGYDGVATISGTPRSAGIKTFTVWAVAGDGVVAKRTYQLIINERDGSLFGP